MKEHDPKFGITGPSIIVDGVRFPGGCTEQRVEDARTMKIRDNDVFICTYPKCGTTWVQHIVLQLLHNDHYKAGRGSKLHENSLMIEMFDASVWENFKEPRVLKSHMPSQLVPWSAKAKYIVCFRNPKDCFVSRYHFLRALQWKIGFDEYMEREIKGEMSYGTVYDYMSNWLKWSDRPNILFLRYEDMLADLTTEIRKIAHFLGGVAAEVVNNRTLLDEIVKESTFGAMKVDQDRFMVHKAVTDQGAFIRKGVSGDWRNYFNKQQSDRVDELYKRQLQGTAAENWWKREMEWIERDKYDIS